MSIAESLELAFKNIIASKTRTILTMLGIIIGVAAVIVIVGLGNGLENYVTESFAGMGTNSLTVMVQPRGATRTLEVEDMYELVAENSRYFDLCTPSLSLNATVKIGSETTGTTAAGVSEDGLEIDGFTVAKGRGLQYSDILRRARVCVVGAYVDMAYFGGNAVGQTLRVWGQALTVVGVLEQKSDELEEGGTDDLLYLPYSTASRMSSGRISQFVVTVRSEDAVAESKAVLENALEEFFGSDDFYDVISMAEILEAMTAMIDILVLVLAGIAAISLVVGGIGIMNIMLVSVTERTREIGIRKSLGAKERYIMQQFVIEAAATSALGGVIGILLGYGLSAGATRIISLLVEDTLTVAPSAGAVLLAFGISVGIGILFGYLPAKKAAVLNPIDALHYD